MNENDAATTPGSRRIAILGAGITGISLATRLSGHPELEIHLFERKALPSGLLKSVLVDGDVVDIGPYFFASRSDFAEFLPGAEHYFQEHSPIILVVAPDGSIQDFPFSIGKFLKENSVFALMHAGISLVLGRLFRSRTRSAASYAEHWMGSVLFRESGLKLYMERFFHTSASLISHSFARDRMSLLESITFRYVVNMLLPRRKAPPGPAWVALVRKNGIPFSALFEESWRRLEDRGVQIHLSTRVESIEQEPGTRYAIRTDSGTHPNFDRVISTIPLPSKLSKTGASFHVEGKRSLDLVSLFIRAEPNAIFSVLYNHSKSGLWKRVTNFGHIYRLASGKPILCVEITLPPASPLTPDDLFQDFRSSCGSLGVFLGDIEFITSERTDFAYPNMIQRNEAEVREIKESFQRSGISLLGRQGEFKHISSSDCMARVAEFVAAHEQAFSSPS